MRLRYAPSPTGYLHIGNARTALFNYLFTKHNGGDFIVRIEDTDISRNIKNGEKSQLDNLKWLGINWDESIDTDSKHKPYNQLARHELGIYKKYADDLVESNAAYRCFCTSEQLEQDALKQKELGQIPKYSKRCSNLSEAEISEKLAQNMSYSIRFRVDESKVYKFDDIVKSTVEFTAKDVTGDFNLIKQNGIPTYNFAVVIDDHLMEITHVLRGEDHISNTPKQMMIYEALKFDIPKFGHMTLIVNDSGKKLSKRDTSIVQFIEEYKDLGYLPEAMFNFIALLGWSPVGEDEIFSKEQFIEMFDENRLSKSSAKFDVNKLKFLNNQYMKKLSDEDYINFVKPYFDKFNKIYNENDSLSICMLFKDQISYAKEIEQLSSVFFNDEIIIDEESKEFIKQDFSKQLIELYLSKLESLDNFDKSIIKEVGKELEIKGKNLFMTVRIASTGQMHGPDLTQCLEILGKDKIIKNIRQVLEL